MDKKTIMNYFLLPTGKKFSGQTSAFDSCSNYKTIQFPIWDHDKSFFYNISELIKCRKLIRMLNQNDTLTISLALGLSFISRVFLLLLFTRFKVECEIHSGPKTEITKFSLFLLGIICKNSSIIKVLGNDKRINEFAAKRGIKIKYIRNKVTLDNPIKLNQPRKYKYGFIALNIESKGYRLFIDLMRQNNSLNESVLAGPFSRSKKCSKLHNEINFKENISSYTSGGGCYIQSVNDKSKYYLNVETLIITSGFSGEALPMVFLEALFHGCRVVTFDVGFLKEHFSNKNGIYFADDIEQMLDLLKVQKFNQIDYEGQRNHYLNYINH